MFARVCVCVCHGGRGKASRLHVSPASPPLLVGLFRLLDGENSKVPVLTVWATCQRKQAERSASGGQSVYCCGWNVENAAVLKVKLAVDGVTSASRSPPAMCESRVTRGR